MNKDNGEKEIQTNKRCNRKSSLTQKAPKMTGNDVGTVGLHKKKKGKKAPEEKILSVKVKEEQVQCQEPVLQYIEQDFIWNPDLEFVKVEKTPHPPFDFFYDGSIFPSIGEKFTFIDLFAGIGGFRLAAQNLGGKCVFSSEFDANAQKTYAKNFGEMPYGDITLKETKDAIPEKFDFLFGGFPCQPFSIAGYRKGFSDTRGTLFYDIAEILQNKKPRAVFLENVKNLTTHDGGKTFDVIKSTLEELGYVVFYKVMNAMEYANIPQNRERIFIVCFDPKQVPNYKSFNFPEPKKLIKTIHDCIDTKTIDSRLIYNDSMLHYAELVRDITDTDSIFQWRRQYVRKNQSHVCPTLTANMGTGGHNVPLILNKGNIRKLSPRECLNFQGFPKNYQFPKDIPMSAMYKQAGNSVVVPLIQAVCEKMLKTMDILSEDKDV